MREMLGETNDENVKLRNYEHRWNDRTFKTA